MAAAAGDPPELRHHHSLRCVGRKVKRLSHTLMLVCLSLRSLHYAPCGNGSRYHFSTPCSDSLVVLEQPVPLTVLSRVVKMSQELYISSQAWTRRNITVLESTGHEQTSPRKNLIPLGPMPCCYRYEDIRAESVLRHGKTRHGVFRLVQDDFLVVVIQADLM